MKLSLWSSHSLVVALLLSLHATSSLASRLGGLRQKSTEEKETPFHRSLPQNDNEGAEEVLTNKLQQIYEEGIAVGFAVSVLDEDGEAIYKQGFGQSNQRKDRPYTDKTVQPIASVSKTLVALALMKCQELGALELDDPMNDYLPFPIVNPFFPDNVITVRHLATHTSSILDDEEFYERSYIFERKISSKIWSIFPKGSEERKGVRDLVRLYNSNQDMPLVDFVRNIYLPDGDWYNQNKAFSKDFAPGENYEYSNMGTAIASMVIEGALQNIGICLSYAEFVTQYITDPLGMKSSGWNMADYKKKEKSKLYQWGRATDPAIAIPDYKLITVADGGFVTNAKDMSKYIGAVIQGYLQGQDNVLTAESYKQMIDENIFWSIEDEDGNFFGHSGGDPGVNTLLLVELSTKHGFYFAANGGDNDGALVDEVFQAMLEYVFQKIGGGM